MRWIKKLPRCFSFKEVERVVKMREDRRRSLKTLAKFLSKYLVKLTFKKILDTRLGVEEYITTIFDQFFLPS